MQLEEKNFTSNDVCEGTFLSFSFPAHTCSVLYPCAESVLCYERDLVYVRVGMGMGGRVMCVWMYVCVCVLCLFSSALCFKQ